MLGEEILGDILENAASSYVCVCMCESLGKSIRVFFESLEVGPMYSMQQQSCQSSGAQFSPSNSTHNHLKLSLIIAPVERQQRFKFERWLWQTNWALAPAPTSAPRSLATQIAPEARYVRQTKCTPKLTLAAKLIRSRTHRTEYRYLRPLEVVNLVWYSNN